MLPVIEKEFTALASPGKGKRPDAVLLHQRKNPGLALVSAVDHLTADVIEFFLV